MSRKFREHRKSLRTKHLCWHQKSGTKKDQDWQSSSEHSHEQFGTIWGHRTWRCGVSRQRARKFTRTLPRTLPWNFFAIPSDVTLAPQSILESYTFGIVEGFCALKICGKERHFQGAMHEICSFGKVQWFQSHFLRNHLCERYLSALPNEDEVSRQPSSRVYGSLRFPNPYSARSKPLVLKAIIEMSRGL